MHWFGVSGLMSMLICSLILFNVDSLLGLVVDCFIQCRVALKSTFIFILHIDRGSYVHFVLQVVWSICENFM